MDAHLYSEGVDLDVENDYWLSQENTENWESINRRVEKGQIGTREIYRKIISDKTQEATYRIALNFFEEFNPNGAEIPEATIEQNNGDQYLFTEGIENNMKKPDRDEAYDFASLMTLLGDIEWPIESNTKMRDNLVLLDLDYFGEYRIHEAQTFKERVLERWFKRKGYEFDESEFNKRMERHAEGLPRPEQVARILEEKNEKQNESHKEKIGKIEEALKTAEKGDLTIDRISKEISDADTIR